MLLAAVLPRRDPDELDAVLPVFSKVALRRRRDARRDRDVRGVPRHRLVARAGAHRVRAAHRRQGPAVRRPAGARQPVAPGGAAPARGRVRDGRRRPAGRRRFAPHRAAGRPRDDPPRGKPETAHAGLPRAAAARDGPGDDPPRGKAHPDVRAEPHLCPAQGTGRGRQRPPAGQTGPASRAAAQVRPGRARARRRRPRPHRRPRRPAPRRRGPRRAEPRAPVTASADLGNGASVTVTIEPGTHGPVDIEVTVSGTTPKSVTATASQPDRQLGPIPVDLRKAGAGVYSAGSVDLPVSGDWVIDLVVTSSAFDAVTADVTLHLA